MPTVFLRVDRGLVVAAVLLTCVLFTAQAADPVNVIKLTALMLCAIALVVSFAVQTTRTRVLQVPWGFPGAAALALTVAFVASTVAAPVTTTAVLGAYGRNSGLLAYLSAIVLFVVALRVFGRTHTKVLIGGLVAAGLFTASYGLLQLAGIDAIRWNNPFNPIISTLGNPNFAAGYLGITACVAVGGALWPGWATGWRITSGVTAAMCLVAGFLSSSVQGPISAAGGLFVLAVAVLLNQPAQRRNVGLGLLGTTALIGVASLVAGVVAKAGPAAPLFMDTGSRARYFYWDAALTMLGDRPLLGVGLDQYGNFWRSARSTESVQDLGGPSFADAAHSVPLQMLAQGGLLLGVVYAGFVLLTLFALVRGLLRLRGRDRMLLATVGAGWAAYQVQSSVSIDQVPLLVLHFVLAAAVFTVSGMSSVRQVRLPGALTPVVGPAKTSRGKGRARVSIPRQRKASGSDVGALVLVGILALFAAFQALAPLRANVAVATGDQAVARGDDSEGLAAYDHALDLVPGQADYWLKKGRLFQKATPREPAQALEAFESAVAVDSYVVNGIRASARLAEETGDIELARQRWQQALRVDGSNPETVTATAKFELRHRGAPRAQELLEGAVQKLPGSAALWAVLGDARAAQSLPSEAGKAYARALEIDPSNEVAEEGVRRLEA